MGAFMKVTDHSPHEWYSLAEKCYLEKHQGCAWCGGSHRVFCTKEGDRTSYYCQACDSQASYDRASRKYHFLAGEDIRDKGPETMCDDDSDLNTRIR